MPVMVASPLELTDGQRTELEAMVRWSVLPHRQAVQARALLLARGGHRQRGDRPPLRYDDGHGAPEYLIGQEKVGSPDHPAEYVRGVDLMRYGVVGEYAADIAVFVSVRMDIKFALGVVNQHGRERAKA